jgi:hypothetical protein
VLQRLGFEELGRDDVHLTALHEPVVFLLACVLYCMQLIIAGFIGTRIVRAVERVSRRRRR